MSSGILTHISNIYRKIGKNASHLPGSHLSIVGVRVVVSLDRGQVGVERQENRCNQSLLRWEVSKGKKSSLLYLLCAPDARWNRKVAEFIKHL